MIYDVVILGGGPAGLSAAIYAARSGLKTVIVEKSLPGGQMQNTLEIENYPGFTSILGPDLSTKMYEHAIELGVEWKYGDVKGIMYGSGIHRIVFNATNIEAIETHTIIIATGAQPKKLGIPGEYEFSGRGVSYCAVCDGAFFKNKNVYVVGGGDSAVEEGIYLTQHAANVTVLVRGDKLRAQPILIDRANKNPKIEFKFNTQVESIKGNTKVTELSLNNNGIQYEVSADGVFIYIGNEANTDFLDPRLLDQNGYVIADALLQTRIPGIFAAGDVRTTPLRQVVTAVSDGALAGIQAYKYVENLKS